MKVIDVQQGTPEWLAVRCGVPSASNFDLIIDTKGNPSKQRQKYLYRLAGEKITGVSEETYQNGAMKRGIEMEPEARETYELITDAQVQQVGFCLVDGAHAFGASPDGLIGDDGLLEIKCPTLAVHVGYLLGKVLPADYYQQTQGQLLVTGRAWLDFVSYYPGIRPLIVRATPDMAYQQILRAELERFCDELKTVVSKLK